MGNTNSASKSSDDLPGDHRKQSRSKNPFLNPEITHRRSRSAVSDRIAAPPPYSESDVVPAPPFDPKLPPTSTEPLGFHAPPMSDNVPSGSFLCQFSINSQENALEMLRKVNTVIVMDDSTSMEGALWTEVRIKFAHYGIQREFTSENKGARSSFPFSGMRFQIRHGWHRHLFFKQQESRK